MKQVEAVITFAISMIVLGAGLVAYAHANFASKSMVETMDQRIYELHQKIIEGKDVKKERLKED